MGKQLRNGSPPQSFSQEELDVIAGHYIHCSANWNALPADADGTLYGGALPAEQIIFINRPDRNWIRTIYDMQGRIVTS